MYQTGVPFDVEILIKEELLTCSIKGEKVGEAKSFPTAMETVPSGDVGGVHKLGVITALRSSHLRFSSRSRMSQFYIYFSQ
jgi:hypothetical protein